MLPKSSQVHQSPYRPTLAHGIAILTFVLSHSVFAQSAPMGNAGTNTGNATPMIGLPNPDVQRGGAPYTPRDCSQAPDPGRCLARQQYMQNRQGGMGGGMQGQQGQGMGNPQGGMPPGQGMGRPQGQGGMNGGQGHPPRDCSQAPDPGRCQARQQHMQNQQGGMGGGMQGQQGKMPPGQGVGRPQGAMPSGQGMSGFGMQGGGSNPPPHPHPHQGGQQRQ